MRTFVLGDVHGAFKALIQVLDQAKFDPVKDTLIFLGDVADGWSEVKECIFFFMGLPNFIGLMGNHDWWAQDYLHKGIAQPIWIDQGGKATLQSFSNANHDRLRKYFSSLHWKYHDEENDRLYVHGGVPVGTRIIPSFHDVMWDRGLAYIVRDYIKEGWECPYDLEKSYKEIYFGHTTTQVITGDTEPANVFNLWALDTGAGWSGKLTLMDVDTKEYWQSDYVENLYPDEKGRRG